MAVCSGQWARAQERHGLSGGRSQLGLAFVGTVQLLVLLEVALRVAGGHAIVLSRWACRRSPAPTRAWCNVPVRA